MSIEQLKNSLSENAKDIKINLRNLFTEEGSTDLNIKQIYSIALSCAYSIKNAELIKSVVSEAEQYMLSHEIKAAKSSAVIMAMNNIYYRFIHLVSDKSYSTMPARLRMNIINDSGIDKTDFELNCLAVSALNGCGLCMDAHVKELSKRGVTQYAIQSAVRIAAVLNAVAMDISAC
jgi:alkyl hydroperoxide reductase subunit D